MIAPFYWEDTENLVKHHKTSADFVLSAASACSAVSHPYFSEVIPYDLTPNAKMSLQMIHLKGYQLEPVRMAALISGFGSRW